MRWDLIVALFAPFRRAEDRGLGDTVAHAVALGSVGVAPLVATWIKYLGMDCGCDARQTWLNERFPYAR